jgi:hypothetical protein
MLNIIYIKQFLSNNNLKHCHTLSFGDGIRIAVRAPIAAEHVVTNTVGTESELVILPKIQAINTPSIIKSIVDSNTCTTIL